jgi:hypothetical protein
MREEPQKGKQRELKRRKERGRYLQVQSLKEVSREDENRFLWISVMEQPQEELTPLTCEMKFLNILTQTLKR